MNPAGARLAGHTRRTVVAAVALLALSACGLARRPMVLMADGPARTACRQPSAAAGVGVPQVIVWMTPAHPPDRARLDAWCDATGAPVIVSAGRQTPASDDEGLVVVSWNVHEGRGDVAALVARLRSGDLTQGRPARRFALLLQEAVRHGDLPAPRAVPDIVAVAHQLGLSLYYVASARIGRPPAPSDRGGAILSTEPLSGFRAIELPFERQRRLAIEATVGGTRADGTPWTMRLVNAHLESTASARRLRVLVSAPRLRQARALIDALGATDNLIVGGDFNTWLGFSDPTYRTMAAALPDVSHHDRRRTFGRFFRLDHLFARPPAGWRAWARRLDQRLGSDHYPLLAHVHPEETLPTD